MYVEQEQLYNIARHQKTMLTALLTLIVGLFVFPILFGFLVSFLGEVLPANTKDIVSGISAAILLLAFVGVGLWQTIAYFRLAFAVEMGAVAIVVYLLGLLIPLISLLMVLVVSNKATKALKAAGYKVGLLGTDVAQVKADLEGVNDEMIGRFR
jgi:hypothetical protein